MLRANTGADPDPDAGSESGPGSDTPGETAPRVPGWEPVRLLGEGAQAQVWLVQDLAGAEAALKLPRAGGPRDAMAAEAAALAHVRHPHLLSPLGTVETDRGLGVLSEHRPAGTLADLVRAVGPLTPGQAVTVLVPLAQALAHLHEHGIVHGDVAPANVLFGVDGRPALADLGVARVVGGAQGLGGTPGFAAPEALRALEDAGAQDAGAPETGLQGTGLQGTGARGTGHPGALPASPGPDGAADVFAWGALGWFALTGRAPGPAGHRAPLPVLVPHVPVELALLLDAALDPDPHGRPEAAEAASAAYRSATPEPVPLHESAPVEVAHLLPTLLPGGATASGRRRRRSAPARGRREPLVRGRRMPLVAGGALALAAGLAVTGAVLTRSMESGQPSGDASVEAATASRSAVASGAAVSSGPGASSASAAASTSPGTGASSVSAAVPTSPAAFAADPAASGRVLEGVGRARTAALTDPRPERLEAYAVPGEPAWESDAGLQRDLMEGGFAFAGLTVTLTMDGTARAAEETVQVPARLRTSGHAVQDSTGAVVERVPEREDAVLLTLRVDGERWRVERVDPR